MTPGAEEAHRKVLKEAEKKLEVLKRRSDALAADAKDLKETMQHEQKELQETQSKESKK